MKITVQKPEILNLYYQKAPKRVIFPQLTDFFDNLIPSPTPNPADGDSNVNEQATNATEPIMMIIKITKDKS